MLCATGSLKSSQAVLTGPLDRKVGGIVCLDVLSSGIRVSFYEHLLIHAITAFEGIVIG